MVSSRTQQWTLTRRPAMPSTRRSQASPADRTQRQNESSASLSPKITRSGRALPPRDAIEQESTARSAKRRKIVSPSPAEAAIDQDVGQPASDGQSQGEQESVLHAASSDVDTNRVQDEAEVPHEEEDEQGANKSSRAVFKELEARPERPPATASVPADTSGLDKLVDQILSVNIRTTPKMLSSAINDPDSEIGKEYMQLLAQFAAAKQRYSGTRPFLSPPDLGQSTPERVGLCRRVNLATFVTSLFDGKVGLEELDNYFLFTFLPRGGTLSKLAASLWIELKTQAFIAAMVTCDPRPTSSVLSVLFNENLRQRLLDVRPGAEELAPSEEDFMDGMRSRRHDLEADLARNDSKTLAQNYCWTDLLENVVSYVSILKLDDHKLTGSERLLLKPRQDAATQRSVGKPLSQSSDLKGNASSLLTKANGFLDTPEESFKRRLARCALLAIQANGVPFFTHDDNLPYPLIPYSTQLQEERPAATNEVAACSAKTLSDVTSVSESSVPHPSQTTPTLVLYARAREASELEALHPPQSTIDEYTKGERRKWTLEEEHALMEGLDRVRGPHWRQILSDEQLKDRTELELKDKARSLKLFFLKAGIEMPFYLKDASKSGSTAMLLKQEEDRTSAVNPPSEAEGVNLA